MKLIECVPNFSEGLNKDVIDTICDSIKGCNVNILDIESGNYSTIEKNLIIRISNDLEAHWSSVGSQRIIVKENGIDKTYDVKPEVSDKKIIFPISPPIPQHR